MGTGNRRAAAWGVLGATLCACVAILSVGCNGTTPQERRQAAINVCMAKIAASRVADASGVWDAEMARIEDPEQRQRAENYRAAINLACEELLAYYGANPALLEPGAPDLTQPEAIDAAEPVPDESP